MKRVNARDAVYASHRQATGMKHVNARVAVDAPDAEPVRMTMTRQPSRIRWPRNATERAIHAVQFRWHLAGIQQQLARAA